MAIYSTLPGLPQEHADLVQRRVMDTQPCAHKPGASVKTLREGLSLLPLPARSVKWY